MNTVTALSLSVCALYVLALRYSLKKPSAVPIMPMFLVTFGPVLVSRPFLSLFTKTENLRIGGWIYWGMAPTKYIIRSEILISIFLIAVIAVVLISRPDPAYGRRREPNFALLNASFFIILVTAPLYIYRGWSIWSGIQHAGYLATFTGHIKAAFFINVATSLFEVAFYFFILSAPRPRTFFMVVGLYLAISASSLGTGQRTEFISDALFAYWAAYYYGYIKFSLRQLLLIGIPLVLISIALNAARLGVPIILALSEGLTRFFWGQGISLFTIVGTLQHSRQFGTFEGFLFADKIFYCGIMPHFTGNFCNNSLYAANVPGLWWQKLTYLLDPQTYFEGGGLGGSIIPSLYLLFNFRDWPLSAALFFLSSLAFIIFMRASRVFRRLGILGKVYFLYLAHTLIVIPRFGLDRLIPGLPLLAAMLLSTGLYAVWKKSRENLNVIRPRPTPPAAE